MKNNIKTLIILALILFCASGCVDLEEKPKGNLSTESFYKSESDFEAAVVGIYQVFFAGYSSYNRVLVPGAGAEDIKAIAPYYRVFDDFTVDPNTGEIGAIWRVFYQTINNANALIGNLGNASEIKQSRIDEFEGQARFMRAFGYFYMTRYFGEVPIIVFENQKDADKVGQSPVSDIYTFIIDDLKIAEEKLAISYPAKGKANKGAAKALLAEVYLNMAGWPLKDPSAYAKARDKAKEVMALGYALEEDYQDLWLVKNKLTNSEFIFAIHGLANNGWNFGTHLHISARPTSEGGWADVFSESRFFNAFPEGYRKEVSFHTQFDNGKNWTEENPKEPFIAKYRDAGSEAGLRGPLKSMNAGGFAIYLRYADVLLMYAEAANMADGSPSAEALEAINKVRRRAMKLDPDTPNSGVDLPSGMSQADFDRAVLAERAWELAFEGKRWFDLVRKEMVVEVNKNLHPNVKETNRLLPKPALDVTLTEGLEQNDGY